MGRRSVDCGRRRAGRRRAGSATAPGRPGARYSGGGYTHPYVDPGAYRADANADTASRHRDAEDRAGLAFTYGYVLTYHHGLVDAASYGCIDGNCRRISCESSGRRDRHVGAGCHTVARARLSHLHSGADRATHPYCHRGLPPDHAGIRCASGRAFPTGSLPALRCNGLL